MKKSYKWIVAIFFISFLGLANTNEVSAAEFGDIHQLNELRTELKDIFPEHADYIDRAEQQSNYLHKNNVMSRQIANQEEPEVIFSETRTTEDSTEYSLVLYDDGSYATTRFLVDNVVWGGGSTSSGSGYTNYNNRTLTVYTSLGRHPMIISGISYSISASGYDSFINYGSGTIATAPVHKVTKKTENSSGPAYVYYSGTNYTTLNNDDYRMEVKLEVGSNTTRVFLNGFRI